MRNSRPPRQWLRGIHENLLTYWVDPGELQQLMASGQVQAGMGVERYYYKVPVALADEGFPTGFRAQTPPRARASGFAVMSTWAEGEGSEEQAYDFVNAMHADVVRASAARKRFRHGQ